MAEIGPNDRAGRTTNDHADRANHDQSGPTVEEWRSKIELAKSYHVQHTATVSASAVQTTSFGAASLNAALIVNAGGIAAILGYAAAQGRSGSGAGLSIILACLIGGLILSALAHGAAYVSQLFFTLELSSAKFSWEHPYVSNPTTWRGIMGYVFQTLAILGFLGSLALFGIGAWGFFEIAGLIG